MHYTHPESTTENKKKKKKEKRTEKSKKGLYGIRMPFFSCSYICHCLCTLTHSHAINQLSLSLNRNQVGLLVCTAQRAFRARQMGLQQSASCICFIFHFSTNVFLYIFVTRIHAYRTNAMLTDTIDTVEQRTAQYSTLQQSRVEHSIAAKHVD